MHLHLHGRSLLCTCAAALAGQQAIDGAMHGVVAVLLVQPAGLHYQCGQPRFSAPILLSL